MDNMDAPCNYLRDARVLLLVGLFLSLLAHIYTFAVFLCAQAPAIYDPDLRLPVPRRSPCIGFPFLAFKSPTLLCYGPALNKAERPVISWVQVLG